MADPLVEYEDETVMNSDVRSMRVPVKLKESVVEVMNAEFASLLQQLEQLRHSTQKCKILSGTLKSTLDERGIDSVEEWERYVAKVEHDGGSRDK
ncbi:unnamed protein product [Heligmosomoides polygyrus]|uniref:Swi5-dependent recombination DNA repair protein 1 homolog n=1 Tax=Heligmosomoides polygyrus TaxID=6339 RepID=A0A183F9W4_HELPZ|nr:unnamed protein product [Heligmosomoides polygyrus]